MTPTPPTDHRLSLAATGRLTDFATAGVIGPAETQIARHLAHLYSESDEMVTLAVALVVAALRAGSVGLDLARPDAIVPALRTVEADLDQSDPADPAADLPWPEPAVWAEHLVRSPLVTASPDGPGTRPLRLVDGLLYLERSWADQERVADAVRTRLTTPVADVRTADGANPDLSAFFDRTGLAPTEPDRQREAALLARRHGLVVIGGGPGTGKTTTVAKVLAVLAAGAKRPPRISLAAPTGKAAARLDGAVRRNLTALGLARLADSIPASATIHRLLGIKPWGAVDRGPDHPLATDVLVVDEVSMLSLHHMRLLLDAVPATARVVLVGDPDQLASVESGAVLADLVAALTGPSPQPTTQPATASPGLPFVRLEHNYRFAGAIGDLAAAIRAGAADQVLDLLRAGPPGVEFVEADLSSATLPKTTLASLHQAVLAVGREIAAAIAAGDWSAALRAVDRHRVLCAHRQGPYGVARWGRLVEGWLADSLPGYGRGGPWYPGLPVQVTHNDETLGVFNGDTGVIVPLAGQARAALATTTGLRLIGPAELGGLEPIHATTIHKAQGSQYGAVSVIVPPPSAALLTRELLYTAITRAEHHVRLVGTADAIAHAVEHQALRASGLTSRLIRPASVPDGIRQPRADKAERD